MANFLTYNPQPGPISALVQGFGTGQQMGVNSAKASLMQEAAERQKIETALQLHDHMKGQAYGNLEFYNTQYRPALIKLGVPEQMLPEAQNVEQLNSMLFRNEQIKALYKQKMGDYKVVSERQAIFDPVEKRYLYPEVSPATNVLMQQKEADRQARFDVLSQKFGYDKAMEMMRQENRLNLLKERGTVERPGSYEMIETEEGAPAWARKGTGEVIPIPGAKRKAKAGSDIEIRKEALKNTSAQGYKVEDPEFDRVYQKNIEKLTGEKPQNIKKEKTIIRTGTHKSGRKVVEYSDGTVEYVD